MYFTLTQFYLVMQVNNQRKDRRRERNKRSAKAYRKRRREHKSTVDEVRCFMCCSKIFTSLWIKFTLPNKYVWLNHKRGLIADDWLSETPHQHTHRNIFLKFLCRNGCTWYISCIWIGIATLLISGMEQINLNSF